MVTVRSEFAAAARALDEAFVRHANTCEVDRLVAAYFIDDALGQMQVTDWYRRLPITHRTRAVHADPTRL